MINPFITGVTSPDVPFYNRINELYKLTSYAQSKLNVVLYAPRRYGKTSLVKRIQSNLGLKGLITLYVDLFGVTSVVEVANRIAQGVYHGVRHDDALFRQSIGILKTHRPILKQKAAAKSFAVSVEALSQNYSGIDLLDNVMNDLGEFIRQMRTGVHIVFDEFQEITKLNDPHIESVMRSHVLKQSASYFFVGSRRRSLIDMFSLHNRPFFQTGLMFRLNRFGHGKLVDSIIACFQTGGKSCPTEVAEKISTEILQHPYYSQRLSFYVFEFTDKFATIETVAHAYDRVLEDEKNHFEINLQGLTLKQVLLLKALAKDSLLSVFSLDFLSKYKLSQGMIQKALPKLSRFDLIEKDQNRWQLVDPVFATWLQTL